MDSHMPDHDMRLSERATGRRWSTSQLAVGSPDTGLASWLAACVNALGSDGVVLPSTRGGPNAFTNVGGFRPRRVPAMVRPSSTEELRQVVLALADSECNVTLYPISTGRNWGLGSGEPVSDNTVVVDLCRMNAIRRIDTTAGVAIVEPGVTQGELAHALASTPFVLNVTTSSAHTSVLGNAVDRGFGLAGQRCDEIIGMEIVTADGEIVRLGAMQSTTDVHVPYPHGVGPGLMSLFYQSGLGITTAVAVRLRPRPRDLLVLCLSFPHDHLAAGIDHLRALCADGVTRHVVKVYSPRSVDAYRGSAPAEFRAYLCVDGVPQMVAAIEAWVRQRAARSDVFSNVRALRPGDDTVDVLENALVHAYAGNPDHNDDIIRTTFGVDADGVDRDSGEGWLFFMPMIPFTGHVVHQAMTLLDEVHAQTGVRCGGTVNALYGNLIDFVVGIRFDRTPAIVSAAHRALDLLHELFAAQGFLPYRVDIDHMNLVPGRMTDPSYQSLLRRITTALDPRGRISPGRYPADALPVSPDI